MARPPKPTMRRYRGKVRADMNSAYNHLFYLLQWDVKYRGQPSASYPNQLAVQADMDVVSNALGVLHRWITSLGPIPSRVPPV